MRFTSPAQKAGKDAESSALRHLKKQGLTLIEQNFQCKMGEIDLIMRDQETLVFIEVRMRNNANFDGAAASVSKSKRNKLWRSAEYFLTTHGQWRQHPARFDVIGLKQQVTGWHIDWIQNAFDASDC